MRSFFTSQRLFLVAALSFLLLLPVCAFGQDEKESPETIPEIIDLDYCVSHAGQFSFAMLESGLDVRHKEINLSRAKNTFFPKVNVLPQYGFLYEDQNDTPDDSGWSSYANVDVRVGPLLDGFSDFVLLKAAKVELQASELFRMSKNIEAIGRIESLFVDINYLQQTIVAQEKLTEQLKGMNRFPDSRPMVSKAEYVTVQSMDLLAAKSELALEKNRLELMKKYVELYELVGLPLDGNSKIAYQPQAEEFPELDGPQVDPVKNALELGVNVLSLQRKATIMDRFPQPLIYGGRSYDVLNDRAGWYITFAINIPIWDQNEMSLRCKEIDLQKKLLQLRMDNYNEGNAIGRIGLAKQWDLAERAVALAEKRVDLLTLEQNAVKGDYEQGMTTRLAYANKREELVRAISELNEMKRQRDLVAVKYKTLSGYYAQKYLQ